MTPISPWPKFYEDPDHLIKDLTMVPEQTWRERAEQSALAFFDSMVKRVPAYKKFLKANNVDYKKVRTIADFNKLPHITKENYLRVYPLSELTWDGDIGRASMISRSSGSSGVPFYWLSNQHQRNEVGATYDIVFSQMFNMRKLKTLVIIAYGMGSWVAGTTTLLSSIEYMNKYDCTFITPGYNKNEVIEICKNLGPQYDQVVLCAYPPLIKEIIDLGEEQGINWPNLQPKFIFGAEAFGEEFRDYILEQVGSTNPYLDTMNTIGSADVMIIGHETPISIALRRMIHASGEFHDQILGCGRMPTLAQYYPWQKYLQVENEELLITSNGAIPLVRYNIRDHAKIYQYGQLNEIAKNFGHTGIAEALPPELRTKYNWQLPFVLLYGKSTNAIKFYGAIIYPENIKAALEKPLLAHNFTGKFKMEKYYDANQSQRLRLHIELSPGTLAANVDIKQLQKTIVETLCQLNSEYFSSYRGTGKKAIPAIKLTCYGQFELNNTNNKHRYV